MLLIIRRVAVHVFVSNRHSTGTSVRLQRCTVVRKCGVHSVNMANVKACFAMQNLKLELGVPPGPFSQSILLFFLSYHACSPVTYQPQRPWLLTDVNVFGRTISLLINTTNAGNK